MTDPFPWLPFEPATLQRAKAADPVGYIVKPFTMVELKRKIGELITRNCGDNHS